MHLYKRILVPIDFSAIGRKAVTKAIQIRGDSGAEIILAHVIDYAPPAYVAVEMPANFTSGELMKERAEDFLEKFAKELSVGSCKKHVEAGNTNRTLLKLIDEYQIELVVMAKHNDLGVLGNLGSTTQHVIKNASCDVLVVHK